MVMYISSAVNYFRSMCNNNDSVCIVIYILYKELDYNIPEDSYVYLEKSVAFQNWVSTTFSFIVLRGFFSVNLVA